jgi:type I restriction enzyme S subunit
MNNKYWINLTLGDLVSAEKKSIISGPFGSNIGKRFFRSSGVPVIRGNNLKTGSTVKFVDSGFAFITKEKADELNSYAAENDLVFTAVGTIGQVGIIEKTFKFSKYTISNKQLRATLDVKKILPLYAYYWFSSPWIEKLIIQRNVGSTVPLINLPVLKGLPIRMPVSLSQQQSIVGVLESIGNKIELNNKINAELEAMAKLIYDYWFVQFDFPDANGKPYKSSGGKMVYNEELKREIPQGWEDGSLSDIMTLQRGVTYSKNDIRDKNSEDVVPVLRATNITGNTIDLEDMVYVTSKLVSKNQKLEVGDVLITMSSGSKDHIGKNGMFHFKEEVAFGAFCARMVPNPGYSSYLFSYTQSDFMTSTIKNECLGTNINNLNSSLVKGFKMVLPEETILFAFEKQVSSLFQKIGLNQKENQKLTELRDWLLPMLMNGQVWVESNKAEEAYQQEEAELGLAAEGPGKYGA